MIVHVCVAHGKPYHGPGKAAGPGPGGRGGHGAVGGATREGVAT